MNKYENLLKQWCDSLVALQINGYGSPHDGALLCKSCTVLHGRADNAIFPLVYTYKLTGDKKYYSAAKMLFRWQERLIDFDGGAYNDGNNTWKATTSFSCIEFCKTVKYLNDILDDDFKNAVIKRIKIQAEWIYNNLVIGFHSNINYYAAAAASMALCWEIFKEEKYLVRSREMIDYCMRHFTESGLLMGEGHPHDGVTGRGCRLVDIGYNFEESVPCLTDAAEVLGDVNTLKALAHHMLNTLDLFMPDGGIDNSFGTRNNKWTYYGSRTSDGCVEALITLSEYAPQLLEAAIRNVELQTECTHDGLLYGGRQYFEAGQQPCTHHTVCHAAGLADALAVGLSEDMPRGELPCDSNEFSYKYYPETDTYKINAGEWLATVTGYDNQPSLVGSGGIHSSGGTVSLLYHKPKGVVIAGSTYQYRLGEPLNMQIPNQLKYAHRTLIPRVEMKVGEVVYASCFDNESNISVTAEGNSVRVKVASQLCTINGIKPEIPVHISSEYIFGEDGVQLTFNIDNPNGVKYILPLIGNVSIKTENEYVTDDIFYLSGGFTAKEYSLSPDADGKVSVKLL